MRRSKFSPQQIAKILKEFDNVKSVDEISREHGLSPSTFYKWRSGYAGMNSKELKRLKELEEENTRLKQMYTTLAFDHQSSFTELKNYVYIGTMSKVVAPALRIGYLASNDNSLIERVGILRKIIDVQGDNIMEQAVLQLIKDGTIKRHIKKATKHYKAKRDFTASLLNKYVENKATYTIPDGGLAFWVFPNNQVDWLEISKKLKSNGITIFTPDTYSFGESINGIRLGYGSLSEKELEEGIVALAKML